MSRLIRPSFVRRSFVRCCTPLLAVVAVAGFVATPASAIAKATPNACKVLKASEVTHATGFTATKAKQQPAAPSGAGICAYTLSDTAASTVSVFVQLDAGRVAKRGYASAKQQFADTLEPVAGFGKQAFYVGGGLDTLYVLKGDSFLFVQYAATGVDDPTAIKPIVETMTKKAAARV
jgi:hypothetical protein